MTTANILKLHREASQIETLWGVWVRLDGSRSHVQTGRNPKTYEYEM